MIKNDLMCLFSECLHAYKTVNGSLPDRIVMFRDGVGEGQLVQVYNVELEQLKVIAIPYH